jgi:hypothetical protein
MVHSHSRGVYSCFFNSLFGISGIAFTLLFNFTSSWRYLHGFSISCAAIALFISIIFFKESVRYLFLVKNHAGVIDTLDYIGKVNGRETQLEDWKKTIKDAKNNTSVDKSQNGTEVESSSTIGKIFRNGTTIYNFMAFNVVSLVIISGIIYNAIDMKTTNNSLLYPIIFYSVDFITILAIGYIIDLPYFGRKKPAIALSFLSAALYFAKYLVQYKNGPDASVFGLDLALRVSVSLSFNVLMEYNFEIYSTDIRSTAFNINKLLSHFGDFFTPLLMSYNRPLATISLAGLYFVMTLFIFKLKETMGTTLKETVDEEDDVVLEKPKTEKETNVLHSDENPTDTSNIPVKDDEKTKMVDEKSTV